MLFKNVSNDRISAYGHIWQPVGQGGDVQEVDKEHLVRKFRLYDKLEAIEFVEKPAEITAETLKSQAIAAGMKIDGRWSDRRLKEEIENYVNGN